MLHDDTDDDESTDTNVDDATTTALIRLDNISMTSFPAVCSKVASSSQGGIKNSAKESAMPDKDYREMPMVEGEIGLVRRSILSKDSDCIEAGELINSSLLGRGWDA